MSFQGISLKGIWWQYTGQRKLGTKHIQVNGLGEMERNKQKSGTLGKFFKRKEVQFQRNISKLVLEHDIALDFVLNLNQVSLSYISLGKYTFSSKESKYVLIKVRGSKRQITATFFVFPIQLTYEGKRKQCPPNLDFHLILTLLSHQIAGQTCREMFQLIIFL